MGLKGVRPQAESRRNCHACVSVRPSDKRFSEEQL